MKRLLPFLLLIGCGGTPQQPQSDPVPIPQPTGTPPPNPGGKTSFAEAQGIMKEYCAECHANAGFTKSEAALRASSAKSRVQNSTMPPPYANPIDATDKAKFMNFF